MKRSILCFAIGALMGISRLASASELPEGAQSVCWFAGEQAYDAAVAAGDALPDGPYQRAVDECERTVDAPMSLNELVAIDGEAWLPSCKFTGGCK